MTQTEIYMIQALTVMVIVIGVFVFMFRLRAKYHKEAIDHVLCEFITPVQTGYTERLAINKGVMVVEPKVDKHTGKTIRPGKIFTAEELQTYDVGYPEGWCPPWIRTKIRKGTFFENDVTPVSGRRKEDTMSPEQLYSIVNERFTEMGTEQAAREKELEDRAKKGLAGATWLYIIGGVTLAGVVFVGVYLYANIGTIIAWLEKLGKALGV